MNPTDYDALIFDCDGTLADTMPAHYVSWRATLASYGIPFSEDRFYALGGVPTTKVVQIVADEAGVSVDAEAVSNEKEHMFHQSLEEVGPVVPVVEIARTHRGALPMAVATGSERWSVDRMLGHLGILDWFDALACADDVTNHKPEPDTFLYAAERLGIVPARCLAYEDTDLGIESARRAGMDTVDVRSMYTPRRITG
jgi:beta-phosphoglucomutase family hydrolase